MNKGKRALVLGGTGAMGTYLVPNLLNDGYQVDVVSLDHLESDCKALRYIYCANAKDDVWLTGWLTQNRYDVIVDFLIYYTDDYKKRMPILLDNTDQLIFLSTYRIYAGTSPITEQSPRLLETAADPVFLADPHEYSLYKAQEEDLLRASGRKNWTAVRPSITFSKRKFQLVTAEADTVIERARLGKPILLPEAAREIEGTMSWGGDVARMMFGLIGNADALGEIYTLSTAEHHKWGEIADYYKDLIGLKAVWVDTDTYLAAMTNDPNWYRYARWQLEYDRLFDRIVDNTKILNAAKMKQEELMPLCDGLKYELSQLPDDYHWHKSSANDRMDEYLKIK